MTDTPTPARQTAIRRVRSSDRLVRTDIKISTCVACGRRGVVTKTADPVCAEPARIPACKRRLQKAQRRQMLRAFEEMDGASILD